MGEQAVYEIARFGDSGELERLQLLLLDGGALLRLVGHGDTECETSDFAAVISSTPRPNEVRADESVEITCVPEIEAQLPLLLVPVLESELPMDGEYLTSGDEYVVEVNGATWDAYPCGDNLPPDSINHGPELNPCWAEYVIEEGEPNPIFDPVIGYLSIGLATTAIVVECARVDYSGMAAPETGRSAVAIYPFDYFTKGFADWLLTGGGNALAGVWERGAAPCSPPVQLFTEEETPADDEPFDADAAPFTEGDYEFLDLPADKAEQIAEDLRAMGHTVEPTDLEFA